jgi:hypothetical protein
MARTRTSARTPISDITTLRAIVGAYLEREADIHEITARIIKDASQADLILIAQAALPSYIRDVRGEALRRAPVSIVEPAREARTQRVFTDGQGRKFASATQRNLAVWLDAQYATLVSLDGSRAERRFGDLTAVELGTLSAYRAQQADQLRAQADRYTRLQAAMQEHDVTTVRQLPDDVAIDILR